VQANTILQLGVYDRVAELALKTSAIEVELPPVGYLLKALPLKKTREMFRANQTLIDYATVAIKKSRLAGDKINNIFSTVLGEIEKSEGAALTELDVVIEAANLILAGSDTTGISLTFVMWNILSRPELKSALIKELEGVSEIPTDAELETLPLFNAVIEESMRVRGALPNGLPRMVPPGGKNLAGHHIPGGMTVTTQAYSLHRVPNAFPDPEK
jgi:cytochrome P450